MDWLRKSFLDLRDAILHNSNLTEGAFVFLETKTTAPVEHSKIRFSSLISRWLSARVNNVYFCLGFTEGKKLVVVLNGVVNVAHHLEYVETAIHVFAHKKSQQQNRLVKRSSCFEISMAVIVRFNFDSSWSLYM